MDTLRPPKISKVASVCVVIAFAVISAACATGPPVIGEPRGGLAVSGGWNIHSVAFSPDGKHLAVDQGSSNTVYLYDVVTGQVKRTFHGEKSFNVWRAGGQADALAFSSDGSLLAAAGIDHSVRIWRVDTGAVAIRLPIEEASAVAFSPDGRLLATGSNDKVTLWDLSSRAVRATLKGRQFVSISPNGRLLATLGEDQDTVRLWKIASGKEVFTLKGRGWVKSVAFSPDSKMLATSDAYTVRLWKTETGQLLETFEDPHNPEEGIVIGLQFLASLLGAGGGHGPPASRVPVAFSPDGKVLAMARDSRPGYRINFLNIKTRKTWTHHGDLIDAMAFSPDGKLLATTGSRLRLLDAKRLREIKPGK